MKIPEPSESSKLSSPVALSSSVEKMENSTESPPLTSGGMLCEFEPSLVTEVVEGGIIVVVVGEAVVGDAVVVVSSMRVSAVILATWSSVQFTTQQKSLPT